MDMEGLESFLTVAQKKSISKAAACLHITQPTLSTRIRRLEEDLGYKLLERSWEGVKLTRQGYYFLPYAIQLLRELSNASTVLTEYNDLRFQTSFNKAISNNECLRIGINTWLAPVFTNSILSVLSNQFPNLDYSFITRPTDTLKDLIEYGQIHVGIYYQNKKETNLISRPLIDDEMVLICSEEDWITMQQNFKNLWMLNKPYLLFDNPVLANNSNLINTIINRLHIKKFQVVDDVNIMNTFLTSNKGYIIIPKSGLYQLANLSSFPIKIVPLGNQLPTVGIHMEYNENVPFIEPIQAIGSTLFSFCETEYVS
jgi:DNA-binding transcriptional LysR family regulator